MKSQLLAAGYLPDALMVACANNEVMANSIQAINIADRVNNP